MGGGWSGGGVYEKFLGLTGGDGCRQKLMACPSSSSRVLC
jgi:hypothetical protein